MAVICGCYFLVPSPGSYPPSKQVYLPVVSLKSHTTIVSSSSRTTLTQTFVNPQADKPIDELRYTFPLYDGVSVVGFVCTINKTRTIRGVVKEKDKARQVYKEAVARGETAGLLEQLPDASDVFTTTIGNVPAGAEVQVEIVYLGELKHDAEADGIRFTIPTSIAPRYGSYPGELLQANSSAKGGIEVTVDVEIPQRDGNHIKTIKSPSHPVGFELKPAANGLSLAKAEISIDALELDKDVVVIVVPAKADSPIAVLEKHPTIPDQRALMATFVPRFNLPSARPEIVFVCDRSGSMGTGKRIANLKTALQVFLKSLPVGVKFNIVSFGSHHSFLFDKSQSYDQTSLDKAMRHVETFGADYGGTEMYAPLEETFKRRFSDMDLEVFMLTDGEIWNHQNLFDMVNKYIAEAKGAIRLFSLGIGNDVSHALVEGLARAGNGFSQTVADNEKMSAKVVRMLKGAISPHINDFQLEVKYGPAPGAGEKSEMDIGDEDDDFEIIEKVKDALVISVSEDNDNEKKSAPKADDAEKKEKEKKPVSLFNPDADPDAPIDTDMKDAEPGVEPKYAHVPAVPTPKLVQAPFNLPPMYNFNRVSVYVLLGPASTPRTPTSVVLRGTSPEHGAVELEIPVVALPEPGETVHQLAAKKAVSELEEGRGWIFAARDAADDKLLKEKYPGRFQDMVEREAVRLGVAFQVGGKWCSFVAVDETSGAEAEEEEHEKKKQSEPSYRPPVRPAQAVGVPTAASFFSHSGPALGRARKVAPPVAFHARSVAPMTMVGASPARPSPSPYPHADANYQMQIMLLEQQGKKRMMMARQEGPLVTASAPPYPPAPAPARASAYASVPSKRPAPPPAGLDDHQTQLWLLEQQSVKRLMAARQQAAASAAAPPPPPPPGAAVFDSCYDSSNAPVAYAMPTTQSFGSAFGGGGGAHPLFGHPPPGAAQTQVFGQRSALGGGGFGSSPAAPKRSNAAPIMKQLASRSSQPSVGGGASRGLFGHSSDDDVIGRLLDADEDEEVEADKDEGRGFTVDTTDPLAALVALQDFEGFWEWSISLFAALGVSEQNLLDVFGDEGLQAAVAKGKVAATASAVVFLRTKLADKADEWEMIVDKAVEWVKAQNEAGGAEQIWAAAAKLF